MRKRLATWVPEWWRGDGGAVGASLSVLLLPAEQIFRLGQWVHTSAFDRDWIERFRAPIPVVSVGNLTVGGTGKTPVAAWIAKRLRREGCRPAVILRGYGADEIEVHRELNPQIPVIADRRRIDGVLKAAATGSDVAVLDDGFQHRTLHRDLDVVLVAAESWSSRDRLLPRGPWRERVEALERADLIAVTRKTARPADARKVAAEIRGVTSAADVVQIALRPAHLHPLHAPGESEPLRWLKGRRVIAVASLADPALFERQLRKSGAESELISFPDHHPFSDADVDRLTRLARERPLVMTRKEAVKLRGRIPAGMPVYFVDQELKVEEGLEKLNAALLSAIGRDVRP